MRVTKHKAEDGGVEPRPERRLARDGDLADRIALDIRAGVYGREGWMKQIDLERRYLATRLEVRRALDKLVDRRIVRHLENRGYHVHLPDERQDAELREVRIILECAAVESVIAAVDKSFVTELRRLAKRFADLAVTGSLLEQYEANIEFHSRFLSRCDNRELVALISDLRDCGPAIPAQQWNTRLAIETSAAEHFDMITALAAPDLPRLRKIVATHIRMPAAIDGPAKRRSA
jgi:DNA-binding GntR family transcriptional regulator